ncbi:MAG: hypothetical protein MK297_12400 [Planctomycetes bacterium]|nr:hypothetical protein [Planctomycetota bacterium]
MATDATPDEVEECFPSTVPLGKRFGTVLVNVGGQGVEVTTLRAEDGYSDGRHPDQVVFGTSVLVDASRRDFTVNAMYLDAISGEFLDPVRGMDSLVAGQLSAVGDAAKRFQEDGLRILRLARFSACLRLTPCEATLIGSRSSLGSLGGVSSERILAELSRAFDSGVGLEMVRFLCELRAVSALFPSAGDDVERDLLRICGHLDGLESLALCLCLVCDPAPLEGERAGRVQSFEDSLQGLKPSRELRASARAIFKLAAALEESIASTPRRGQLLLWMREDAWEGALQLVLASRLANEWDVSTIADWQAIRASRKEHEIHTKALLEPSDLATVGVPRGPRWGALMHECLLLQLDGEIVGREQALEWLSGQSRL